MGRKGGAEAYECGTWSRKHCVEGEVGDGWVAAREWRTGRKPRRPSKLTRAPPRLMERISARMLQSSACGGRRLRRSAMEGKKAAQAAAQWMLRRRMVRGGVGTWICRTRSQARAYSIRRIESWGDTCVRLRRGRNKRFRKPHLQLTVLILAADNLELAVIADGKNLCAAMIKRG